MVEGSSEQSRNQFYMYAYIVLLPPLLPLCCVLLLLLLFFFLLRRHRVDTVCVRFHNRVPGPDTYFEVIIFVLFVRCCTTYECVCVYTCLLLCSVLLCCRCCSCCCLLLLFVIVCRMTKIVAEVHCIWFQCFLSLHSTRFISMQPLAVLSHLQRQFLPKIHNTILELYSRYYGHARSQGGC